MQSSYKMTVYVWSEKCGLLLPCLEKHWPLWKSLGKPLFLFLITVNVLNISVRAADFSSSNVYFHRDCEVTVSWRGACFRASLLDLHACEPLFKCTQLSFTPVFWKLNFSSKLNDQLSFQSPTQNPAKLLLENDSWMFSALPPLCLWSD